MRISALLRFSLLIVAFSSVADEKPAAFGSGWDYDKVFPKIGYVRTEKGFDISVWGRTYRYADSIFPMSVKTSGREIFAAPMKLHASFGGGTEGVFHDWKYTLVKQDDECVQIAASAHCSNVIVNAGLTFERDGFVKTEIKLVPYGCSRVFTAYDYVPDISALWFEAELTPESSTLMHYWPYSDNSCCAGPAQNSGALKEGDYPFRASTWFGWEDGGFSVTCETSEGIELHSPKKWLTVTKEADRTRLRYRLLDHMPSAWAGRKDDWPDALIPMCWEFGLMATPVKARPAGSPDIYRRFHTFYRTDTNPLENGLPERFGKAGLRYVVFHSTFSRAEGYGLIGDKAKFRAIVDAFHRNGVKVLVYYGFEYPTILPDWSKKKDDYLIRHPGGKWVGGWQAETHRAYQSCYKSGWADEVKANALAIVDEYGLDGIYTDGMYIPWECANERHGCGWRDAKGELHPTFPIYAIRDLARDLQAAIHARGGTVDAHQSACMVTPLLAFADSCFDGENVQSALERNPEHLPTDAFRCEYSGYAFGLPMTFIAYTNDKLTIRMLASMTLPHNVHPVPRELDDLDFVASVWKIYEERKLDSAEFVPYWRENVCETKGVYCSLYRNGKELSAVVSNLSKSPKRAELLLGKDKKLARDLLSGKEFPVRDGKLVLYAEPYVPHILSVE